MNNEEFRIVNDPLDETWIVQSQTEPEQWTDVTRFLEEADARRYVLQVGARHRVSKGRRKRGTSE